MVILLFLSQDMAVLSETASRDRCDARKDL